MTSGPKLHTRQITTSTREDGDGTLLVEGELKEDRRIACVGVDGEIHEPHTVHHMIVRLGIATETLTIESVAVDMPAVPHDECPETAAALDALKGLVIAPGFSAKVISLLGGTRGCSHLKALVLAMAPAVMQGFWTWRSREGGELAPSEDLLEHYLIDTCHVWRKGGRLANRFAPENP